MIVGQYKIDAFNQLKNDCIKYMSPERDWHYPRADMYLLYSLTQSPPYDCSAPFWRKIREEIFTELKRVLNKPTIYHLTLVKHNEKSFAYKVDKINFVDIDTKFDLEVAKRLKNLKIRN